MKKALIISVGMGRGIENSIYNSLTSHNPEIAIFLVSKDSKNTLDRRINEKRIEEFYPSRVYILDNEEDLEQVYFQLKDIINELFREGYKTTEIHVDFTTGTKVMSAALALVALIYRLDSLTYVSGKRDDQGRVISGSERTLGIRPLTILLDIELQKIPEFIRIYQYTTALQILTKIKEHSALFDEERKGRIEKMEHLVRGFHAWELFDHEKALEEFKNSNLPLVQQIIFLESLKKERVKYAKISKSEIPTPALVVDILANAERRAEEGNYDDAVARLYRSIEMIGQFGLIKEFDINPSDIDLEKLKAINSNVAARYESQKNTEGKIQLGLVKDFELLCQLNPDLKVAKAYLAKKEDIKKYLGFRNNSILAHGFTPLDLEKYQKLKEVAFSIASSYIQDVDKKISELLGLFKDVCKIISE